MTGRGGNRSKNVEGGMKLLTSTVKDGEGDGEGCGMALSSMSFLI